MDDELVALAQRGDRHAFESLTLAHHSRLFRVAFGILRDRHTAEDATQQAFIDIWRYIGRLRDPARFDGWSYRLLVHACYAEARRRSPKVLSLEVRSGEAAFAPDELGSVIDREQLERAFRRLSVDQRAVILLRHLVGLSPEEIAEALGIPRRTVYSRLKRALHAMRGALEADARGPAPSIPRPEVAR
jgi:RNA polymerase sigma-70 factor, ECF subfamily